MKISKILLIVLICLALLPVSVACAPAVGNVPSPTPSATVPASSAIADMQPSDPQPEETAFTPDQLLYNANGINIALDSISESAEGPEIKVGIKNGSVEDITVRICDCRVNGLSVDAALSADVLAGQSKDASIIISGSNLEEYQIFDISLIELSFCASESNSPKTMDTETWVSLFFNGTGNNPNSGPYASPEILEGKILYRDGEILVMYQSVSYNAPAGPSINIYIENNTDQSIIVEGRDFSVNGSVIDPVFSSEVAPGETADAVMLFSQEDFDAAGITEIENMLFSLEVIDPQTGEYIVLTDPIVLNLK